MQFPVLFHSASETFHADPCSCMSKQYYCNKKPSDDDLMAAPVGKSEMIFRNTKMLLNIDTFYQISKRDCLIVRKIQVLSSIHPCRYILHQCSCRNAFEYSPGDGSRSVSTATGNFNKDVWLDFAVTNFDGYSVGAFLGLGVQYMATETSYSTGSGPHSYSVVVSDLNKDTFPDLIILST
ncbi:unnamed protein product [Rotaria magnacalcarata]|uniref:Uncharacterized protein n=1 Tax=Rotaria magnacalcarata TaxID=392030 RepID=A0A8S2TLD1_9BILA|nr:unnamed protein product [Rotaria magnacalcarata]